MQAAALQQTHSEQQASTHGQFRWRLLFSIEATDSLIDSIYAAHAEPDVVGQGWKEKPPFSSKCKWAES